MWSGGMQKGLFLSTLLIKVSNIVLLHYRPLLKVTLWQSFKQIFTSPSSAASVSVLNNHFDYEAIPSSRKKVRMRKGPPWTNIASLIGLKSLTPRAITYMAVQVCSAPCDPWYFYTNWLALSYGFHFPMWIAGTPTTLTSTTTNLTALFLTFSSCPVVRSPRSTLTASLQLGTSWCLDTQRQHQSPGAVVHLLPRWLHGAQFHTTWQCHINRVYSLAHCNDCLCETQSQTVQAGL